MMGSKSRIFHPVESVTLDHLVPADHFYRHVEQTLDLTFVRDLVAASYAATGRPSIDPVVFFKLQLVMFFEGIRSERQLLLMAADRLSVRWYLGYDLNESLPDHSSLTRIRDRYGIDIFRRFFDVIVTQCQQAGLVWGQELYIDATQVDANASLDSLAPRVAVASHLDDLFAKDGQVSTPSTAEPVAIGSTAGEAMTAATDTANRHDWFATCGSPNRSITRGSYRRRSDREASTTDPDAAFMARKAGGLRLGYHDHYVVDGGRARIILTALVTPADVMENQPALDLIWRTIFRWRVRPHQVTGDATYGAIEVVRGLEDAGIHAYMPLRDYDKRSTFFGKRHFTYDAVQDVYRCPQDAILRRVAMSRLDHTTRYQADADVCNTCPCKARCTTSQSGRAVTRHVDAAYHDTVRSYEGTAAYQAALRKRAVWVEPLFGEAKQWHHLDRFRRRGLVKVNGEALLIATGQNLKRLLSASGWGRRSFPGGAGGVVVPSTAGDAAWHH